MSKTKHPRPPRKGRIVRRVMWLVHDPDHADVGDLMRLFTKKDEATRWAGAFQGGPALPVRRVIVEEPQ